MSTASSVTQDLGAALSRPGSIRHRWEMPLVWLSAILTFLILAFVVLALAGVIPEEVREALESEEGGDLKAIAVLAIGLPAFFYVGRFFMAAGVRANSVKVGPTQFPELHARYLAVADRIGMTHLPALYVVNGNGVVNAYAFSCNRRYGYIVLHAEIAHLIDSAPEMVDFVMAHELGHHKLNHVSLWRLLINVVPSVMFLPGKAAIRAQEYSADRLALCACPLSVNSTSLLAVGPTMAKDVNPEAWLQQCHADDRSWLIRLHNILADHAVLTKRYKALKDIEEHGLSRHGQMF
ncbi:MAG: M48 family metallopeptidase [Tabrizicola sp.]|nr:M48 family metallopeptidase [Tabrizicola sp.]